VQIDRYTFDKFYGKLTDAYQVRVVEPNKKAGRKTPAAPSATKQAHTPTVQKIEITAMPELKMRSVDDDSITKGKKRIFPPKFTSTDWSKATIRFINERDVVIIAGTKQVASDFEALGFGNARSGKPDSAWRFLLELARNSGATPTLDTPIPDNIKQHKKTISDRLKALFKNETDPFYDPTDTRVYRIKLTLMPPESDIVKADTLGVGEYLAEAMPERYDPTE
jgi:hypothetical protein